MERTRRRAKGLGSGDTWPRPFARRRSCWHEATDSRG